MNILTLETDTSLPLYLMLSNDANANFFNNTQSYKCQVYGKRVYKLLESGRTNFIYQKTTKVPHSKLILIHGIPWR